MMNAQFTKTIEALRDRDANDWQVADAILHDMPVESGRGWERLADELADQGIDFSPSTLRQYRYAAKAWPQADRLDGISFTAHREAIAANALTGRDDAAVGVLREVEARDGRVTTRAVREQIKTLKPKPTKAEEAEATLVQHWHNLSAAVKALNATPSFVHGLAAGAIEQREELHDLAPEVADLLGLIREAQTKAETVKAEAPKVEAEPKRKPKLGGLAKGRGL